MSKRFVLFAASAALVLAAGVSAQGPILDRVAQKITGKYENATCEQLWQKKGEPKSEEEQRAVAFLRNDPQARMAFINQVAAPIANKMFECGMIA